MAKSEELRRQASRLLLVAKRTKNPAMAESFLMQAGELLDQAQELEAPHDSDKRDPPTER
jgi:hypothetical protein